MEIIIFTFIFLILTGYIFIQGALAGNLLIVGFALCGLWFVCAIGRILYIERVHTSNDTKETIKFIVSNKRWQDLWVMPLLIPLHLFTSILCLMLMIFTFIITGKSLKEQNRLMAIKKYASPEDEHKGIITEKYRAEYPDEDVEYTRYGIKSIATKKEWSLRYLKGCRDVSHDQEQKARLQRMIESIENS